MLWGLKIKDDFGELVYFEGLFADDFEELQKGKIA